MSSWGPQPDPGRDYRAHLALKAKANNQWIYSKTTKKWYTPEEFAFSDEDIKVHRNQASAPQLILMDPRQGLDIANETILRASKFIQQHTKKMWEYYDLKLKPSKNVNFK
ncbi:MULTISPECIES: hypothetical protein [unclassified Pedobacter]|uniref:hypothetical protein n=1 Tax=unclassified Pedobacter TaxID=2628915 RepID=UPI0014223D15|nr:MULTISPECIES: hypothetical protein [unclassified Pedobacter]NII81764.1 hypothetical protein [Pedobacter sp. SG908]NMN35766.1 hypothetical protein [Pedobacter sp. SG918]